MTAAITCLVAAVVSVVALVAAWRLYQIYAPAPAGISFLESFVVGDWT